MKKHTLSLAIVGTLASSLVLSQAVLAEEVETSTEATSSEEVMSDESVAESVADETSAEADTTTTREATDNHTEEANNAITADTTDKQRNNEHSYQAFQEIRYRAERYKDYTTFLTEDSLAALKNVLQEFQDYTHKTDTPQLDNATAKIADVIANLKNNYNLDKSIEELTSKDAWKQVENTPEAFAYRVARFNTELSHEIDSRLLNKEGAELLYEIPNIMYGHILPLPIKEEIVLATNKLNEINAKIKESMLFAEDSQEFRDIQQFKEVRNRAYTESRKPYYSPESLELLKETLEKVPDFNDYSNVEAIRKVTAELTERLNNLTVISKDQQRYHEAVDKFYKISDTRQWSESNRNLISYTWDFARGFSVPDNFDYVAATKVIEDAVTQLSSSTEPPRYSKSLKSTSIDKKNVTTGEHIIFNAQFMSKNVESYHTFKVYRVGEVTPFKTIVAASRSTTQYEVSDEIYSVITITEDFQPGEYEIREGTLISVIHSGAGGYYGDEISYLTPEKFYQRFTVKAKTQAVTEKEEDGKTDEQPKVDNTKPVEDTKTDEQPKVDNSTPEKQPDNATPEVKPSDDKKDEPSQPENQPSDNKKDEQPQVDHKQDNTTPEVKPSVDVKPMDMPTSTKGDEKKDKVTEVTKEKTEVTTPVTSAPSTPTATPSKPASSAQALPETGELDSLFGLSALAILASVGLVAPALRRREQ